MNDRKPLTVIDDENGQRADAPDPDAPVTVIDPRKGALEDYRRRSSK